MKITKEYLTNALIYRSQNQAYVLELMSESEAFYPPIGEECKNPEVWTAAHWNWLHAFMNNKIKIN